MGMVSKHISVKEVECRCGCGLKKIDPAIIAFAETIHDHFNTAVGVNCACRCKAHNEAVGGEPNSQHLPDKDGWCHAMDIKVVGVHPNKVQAFADTLIGDRGGVGRYDTFTHIDNRMKRARWDYRKSKGGK